MQKLEKITLENFKGSTSKLEVRFNDAVTYLIGVNGVGKSMIGRAIQFLFTGKTFFNPKYRRKMISDDAKRMKVSGEFVNKETGKTMLISQSLTTNDTPNLKIETSDGSELEMAEVLEMINPLYLRPFSIINETPKRQAEMVGVDTNECDLVISKAKEKLVPLRAEVDRCKKVFKSLGDKPKRVEPINLKELYDQRDGINKFNSEQNDKSIKQSSYAIEIRDLEELIAKKNEELEILKKELSELPAPKVMLSLDKLNLAIATADDTNDKAKAYEYYDFSKQDLERVEVNFATEEKNVTKANEAKIEYIKSCKVPDKISFDDEGGLMINAFAQKNAYLNEDFFSRGEILRLAIQLCLINIRKHRDEGKDTIPFIFIDNAEGLDKKNLAYIDEINQKHKIQFVLAYQDDQPKPGKSCIMLNEKIIKKYKDKV